MMKRLGVISSTALLIFAAAAVAAAQDNVQTVRDLYASAAYEEALAAVGRLPSDTLQHEVEQYRVFSLTALGRTDEAQKAMEALIQADPAYVLDPAETPPRVQEAFTRVQQRLLPVVTKQLYLDARAALDRKDRDDAVKKFEKLLRIIDMAGPATASMGELRVLADGFLSLSRALPAAAAAASAPVSAVATPPSTPVVTTTPSPSVPEAGRGPAAARGGEPVAASAPVTVSAAALETRPVAISQGFPAWFPSDSLSRRSAFSGSVRVNIGVDGRVTAAEIVRSVHPTYDSMLLRAARGWLYQPAKRNDVAVASEIVVEVNLRPPQ